MNSATRRRLEILTPAGVTFVAVVVAIAVSPLIASWPWVDKPCGLREATGWPCLTCGGTRSVQALASGDLAAALRFNPLVFVGVCVAVLWLVVSLWKAWKLVPPRPRDPRRQVARARWWLIGLGLAAIGNWVYLVFHLPP